MWPVPVCIACTHLAAATATTASELSYRQNHLKVFDPNIRMSHLPLACNPKQSTACSSGLCTIHYIGKVCRCVCVCVAGSRVLLYTMYGGPSAAVGVQAAAAGSASEWCTQQCLLASRPGSSQYHHTPATRLSRSQARVLQRQAGFSTSAQ